MEWYEILIIALAALIIFFGFPEIWKYARFHKIVRKTTDLINSKGIKAVTTKKQNNAHHLEFSNDKEYLIKILDMNPTHEVIVTNTDNVAINEEIKNWKRSTKPHFVPGMRQFITENKNSAKHVKIVLIYPGCHNITKYINESDAHVVSKFQKVDGTYFIRFADLEEFLENQ